MKLVVLLKKPGQASEQTEMNFLLDDNPVVDTFCGLIDEANSVPSELFTAWGMDASPGDCDYFMGVLNSSITTFNALNEAGHHISYEVNSDNLTNDLLNAIHNDFELYMKAVTEHDTDLVRTGSKDLLVTHLNNVNNYVHLLESYLTRKAHPDVVKSYFTARFRAKNSGKHFDKLLADADYDCFTMEEKFGNVYVNYATTGKNLQQVYWSNDLELLHRPNAISAQRIATAGIIALFNSTEKSHQVELEKFARWCEEHEVLKYGYDISDKRNGLGMLKLGELLPTADIERWYDNKRREFNPRPVIEHYSPYSDVVEMKIVR